MPLQESGVHSERFSPRTPDSGGTLHLVADVDSQDGSVAGGSGSDVEVRDADLHHEDKDRRSNVFECSKTCLALEFQ